MNEEPTAEPDSFRAEVAHNFPMTPDRAEHLAARWNAFATTTALGSAILGMAISSPLPLIFGGVLAGVCWAQAADHRGWRRGYGQRSAEEWGTRADQLVDLAKRQDSALNKVRAWLDKQTSASGSR